MNKTIIGILFGILAGIIDVIPMMIQGLSWDANISAFSMWVVVGFFISTIQLSVNSIVKGIVIAFLVLLPAAILIGTKEPISLLPISIMTLILGGSLGIGIEKATNRKRK